MKIVKIDAKTLSSIKSKKATGLSAHFDNMSMGKMPTPRTPLFKNKSESEVKAEWQQVLDAHAKQYPRLIEYENTRWSKFGPQGGTPPMSERMQALELYYTRMQPAKIIDSPNYQRLIKQTRDVLFSNHSLRALSPEQVLNRDIAEDKLNTNSGLPDFSRRNRDDVRSKAVDDAKSGLWKIYPAILGSRSSRLKPRFIFMFPMSVNLVEKQYVIPIMDAIRQNKVLSFAAWEGFSDVELAFHSQKAFDAQFKAAMDYTGMDQTMGKDQMQIVYDILAPVFQPQYRNGLRESIFHSIEIPIMLNEKEIIHGMHGLASGSGWTNLSESVLSQFVHEIIKETVPLRGDQLLGDDGAMTYNGNYDFAKVIEQASALCGLEANADKQRIDDKTLTYLQRFFDEDIFIEGTDIVAGSYPSVLALNAGMNPEKFHDPKKWNGRMEILRWIMILENTAHNPLFHKLVDFFIKGDKYRLGIDIPGFLKRGIVEDYKIAKTIKGFVPSYNQNNIERGILDFEVVKYLRSKI